MLDQERVVVAEILRPRGIRGELLVRSQSDVPGRLESLREARVRLRAGSDVSVHIVEAWPYRDDWVLKFSGVDSMNEAEPFRGGELWIPLAERGALADGEHFRSDLIGCCLIDRGSGQTLGLVEDWQHYGGPLLLQVKKDGKEVLIPFVPDICREVDLAGRRILVELPEGLLEL